MSNIDFAKIIAIGSAYFFLAAYSFAIGYFHSYFPSSPFLVEISDIFSVALSRVFHILFLVSLVLFILIASLYKLMLQPISLRIYLIVLGLTVSPLVFLALTLKAKGYESLTNLVYTQPVIEWTILYFLIAFPGTIYLKISNKRTLKNLYIGCLILLLPSLLATGNTSALINLKRESTLYLVGQNKPLRVHGATQVQKGLIGKINDNVVFVPSSQILKLIYDPIKKEK